MKTKIQITGQVGGNHTLLRSCQTANCEVSKNFQNFTITFETKKEAIKALSGAYQYLRQDKEDAAASCMSYRRGYSLSYDASTSYIESR